MRRRLGAGREGAGADLAGLPVGGEAGRAAGDGDGGGLGRAAHHHVSSSLPLHILPRWPVSRTGCEGALDAGTPAGASVEGVVEAADLGVGTPGDQVRRLPEGTTPDALAADLKHSTPYQPPSFAAEWALTPQPEEEMRQE